MRRPRWPVVPLGTIAEFRNGLNYNKSNFGTGLKVINVKDFQDRLIADVTGLDQINPTGLLREECLIREGDILFVRSNGNRDLIGRSMLVTGVTEPISHSAFSIKTRFTCPDVLPRFYAYLFRTSLIRSELSNRGSGTNISNLNQDILNSLRVPKPSLSIQHKIAGVLSTYDDLIENNARRISLLEDMARRIFSQYLKDSYPSVPFSSLFKEPLRNGVYKPKQFHGFGIKIVNMGELFGNDVICDQDMKRIELTQKEKLGSTLAHGDLLFARRSLVLEGAGKCSIVMYPKNELTFESSMIRARLNRTISEPLFYFYFFRSKEGRALMSSIATRTAVSGITGSNLADLRVPCPPIEMQQLFVAHVSDMVDLGIKLRRSSSVLRGTRDLLLPKLISGQLDIEELDIDCGNDEVTRCEVSKISVPVEEQPVALGQQLAKTPYKDDAAILCVLVDALQKANRPTTEFVVQKHAFALKHLRCLPINSQFVSQKAGPWSQELRRKALHAGDGSKWLHFDEESKSVKIGIRVAQGLEHGKKVLGDKYDEVAKLVGDLIKFGDHGLERWMTVFKVVCDLRDTGTPITRAAIQKGIDDWPGKREKPDFSEEKVETTIQGMLKQGWFTLG